MSKSSSKGKKEKECFDGSSTSSWIHLNSFEMQDLIGDPNFLLLFYDYLRSTHSEEILACWIDIEIYKVSLISDRSVLGKNIVNRYFNPQSKSYLGSENIPSNQLDEKLSIFPDRSIFDSTQVYLWDILCFQWFPKIIQTDLFKKMISESNYKQRKKDLLKAVSKAFKDHENIVFAETLDHYVDINARYIPFIPTISDTIIQIEDIMYDIKMLAAFIDHLEKSNSNLYISYLDFWIEAELYKYSEPTEEKCKEIFMKFLFENKISISGINPHDLMIEIETPNKNLFSRHQNYCWNVLKEKVFPTFEISESFQKFINNRPIEKKHDHIIRNMEKLNQKRSKTLGFGSFRNNLKKVEYKIKYKYQAIKGIVVDIWNVISEKESLYAFNEYLLKKKSSENLNFWIDAELFKYSKMENRKSEGEKIWEKYFLESGDHQINIDLNEKKTVRNALNQDYISIDTFYSSQESVWDMLDNDLRGFLTTESGIKIEKLIKKKKTIKFISIENLLYVKKLLEQR